MKTATALGNWWLAASSWQHTRSCITFHADFFCKTPNYSGDSAPLQPRFGPLWLLAFSKTKISFEREEISDHWWDSGKCDKAADGNSNDGFLGLPIVNKSRVWNLWGVLPGVSAVTVGQKVCWLQEGRACRATWAIPGLFLLCLCILILGKISDLCEPRSSI